MLALLKRMVALVALLLFTLPAGAQFGAADTIVLQPFLIEAFAMQGLSPAGWRENQPGSGVYLRYRDASDRTAIMMQSAETDTQTLLERLQTNFGLTTSPQVSQTITSNNLEWSLYEFTYQQGEMTMFGSLATAQSGERAYFVLMQTAEVFYPHLFENLFVPIVQSISSIVRLEDEQRGFSIPLPATWSGEAQGDAWVLQDAENSVRLIVTAIESSDPAGAMTDAWQQFYPDQVFSYEEDALRTVDDPAMLRGLERVTVITWVTPAEEGTLVRQGVAREYAGVQYIILIEADQGAIQAQDSAISIVDTGLKISALEQAQAEATEQAGQ